jgi:cytochrome c
MMKTRTLAGVAALSALVAACSGGSDSNEPEKTTETAAPAPAPADAGPPAATDVTTLDGTTFASFTGNAAAGKIVFTQCRTCHVTDAGVNKTGPSLNGMIGRTAGTVPGFNYSPPNKSSGISWTKEKLFQYFEKPQRVIPKTKMIFAGIPDPQKRADLIAYLENPS